MQHATNGKSFKKNNERCRMGESKSTVWRKEIDEKKSKRRNSNRVMPKSEEWRRDRQKEKILLERSVQNTSVKERH